MNIKNYKYLLVLVLALFIGCNNAHAAYYAENGYCYYKSDKFQGHVEIKSNNGKIEIGKIQLIKFGEEAITKTKKISNENKGVTMGAEKAWQSVTKADIPQIAITEDSNGIKCPEYVLGIKVKLIIGYSEYFVMVDNESIKNNAISIWNSNGATNYYGSNVPKSSYLSTLCSGEECFIGEDTTVTCSTLFDASDESGKSLGSIINSVLQYIRIIVPILIILLGSIDFGKAVISSKEDEMKKAQTTFIKRVLAGIVVFFVPVVVNIVMNLADIVWESNGYSSCSLEEIK